VTWLPLMSMSTPAGMLMGSLPTRDIAAYQT
jgi:hypothetical protein